MKSQIRREINDFYRRYADEYGLTYEQAAREMSRADLQEWRGTVGDYIEQIRREPNPQVRERLMREYDARSYNSRISRLDGLCGNIEMNVNNLYARADEQFRQLLGEEYTGGYYRAMYDLQTRLGYNGQFSTISREMVENTLAYPWSGANFSDRLWRNKTALVDTIRETLTQGMIRGDNIRDMSRAVADKLNSSFRNAERLVRTETSHIHNTAEIAAYEAAGYEEYEFMASLGERTCEVCGGLDGQHFKISEKQFGVNFPPVHPNCRCTTVGWEPEEKELPEGEQREELSYEEWYGKYVEGREEGQITFSAPTDNNSQFSRSPSINREIEREFTRRPNRTEPFDISAFHVDNTSNNIFISGNVTAMTKPKDIHELDLRISESLKLLNAQGSTNIPSVCIASVDEMVNNVAAAYNAVDNVLFVNETLFRLPTEGFACPDNRLSTILHECIHWKDAADYRLEFGAITAQNYRTEYLPYLRERCRISLDRLEKKGYNIYDISPYATDRYLIGAYDETYTEYRVNKILGGE